MAWLILAVVKEPIAQLFEVVAESWRATLPVDDNVGPTAHDCRQPSYCLAVGGANVAPGRLCASWKRREEPLDVGHYAAVRRVKQENEFAEMRRGEAYEIQPLGIAFGACGRRSRPRYGDHPGPTKRRITYRANRSSAGKTSPILK